MKNFNIILIKKIFEKKIKIEFRIVFRFMTFFLMFLQFKIFYIELLVDTGDELWQWNMQYFRKLATCVWRHQDLETGRIWRILFSTFFSRLSDFFNFVITTTLYELSALNLVTDKIWAKVRNLEKLKWKVKV